MIWTGAALVATWFFFGSAPVVMVGCALMLYGLVLTPERLEDDVMYRRLIDRRTS